MAKIYAHRGASGDAPENTMEAFELAAHQGADGIELDVHLSRDGEIVVIHDETIDRVTGAWGTVGSMSLAELKRYAYNRTHPQFAHAAIPTLREVFEWARPLGMAVNVELKTSPIAYEKLEEKCIELAAKMGMEKLVCYSSFNHRSLLTVKTLDASLPCGLLYEAVMVRPWEYAAALGMDAIHPQFWQLMEPGVVEDTHAAGLAVNPWTVNREVELSRVFDTGVDMVITNFPARARDVQKGLMR